jgi:carbon-monoxide dehydrogenase catalytic subunit
MAEDEKKKSIDQATQELYLKACEDEVNTSYDRADSLKPCPIGSVGSCCKHCGMGPCRIPLPKGRE